MWEQRSHTVFSTELVLHRFKECTRERHQTIASLQESSIWPFLHLREDSKCWRALECKLFSPNFDPLQSDREEGGESRIASMLGYRIFLQTCTMWENDLLTAFNGMQETRIKCQISRLTPRRSLCIAYLILVVTYLVCLSYPMNRV